MLCSFICAVPLLGVTQEVSIRDKIFGEERVMLYCKYLEELSQGNSGRRFLIEDLWETPSNLVNNDLVINGGQIELRNYLTTIPLMKVQLYFVDEPIEEEYFYDGGGRTFLIYKVGREMNGNHRTEYLILNNTTKKFINSFGELPAQISYKMQSMEDLGGGMNLAQESEATSILDVIEDSPEEEDDTPPIVEEDSPGTDKVPVAIQERIDELTAELQRASAAFSSEFTSTRSGLGGKSQLKYARQEAKSYEKDGYYGLPSAPALDRQMEWTYVCALSEDDEGYPAYLMVSGSAKGENEVEAARKARELAKREMKTAALSSLQASMDNLLVNNSALKTEDMARISRWLVDLPVGRVFRVEPEETLGMYKSLAGSVEATLRFAYPANLMKASIGVLFLEELQSDLQLDDSLLSELFGI